MSKAFFEQPILNSPYEYPGRHWELDEAGQPTQTIIRHRRTAEFVTPIPKPKKQYKHQTSLSLDEGKGLSTEQQAYDIRPIIAELRTRVDQWRALPNPADWRVTPETARLLQHWRSHQFQGVRPFFCQIEAVETAIWLTEVAPELGKDGQRFLDHLARVNEEANPGLNRLALKLATGAGKTTVMAMLIAWQTINAVRRPGSRRFTRGFLVVTPGITIRDRLRVLLPNDPEAYYAQRELVPPDLVGDVAKAKIVITNYHAFKRRERVALSAGGRALLQGHGPALETLETDGQMLQRVMPELMAMKRIVVLNDEAHHCYRAKPPADDDVALKGDEKAEAEANAEAARVWISGLEVVGRLLGLGRVFDLSATPFFLRGSGYAEGTLFPWTMSDFSLMDAIECGIVKLPRVPVADNIPQAEVPVYRELWKHIGARMPRKGRGKGAVLDPLAIPVELQTALEALYGHYRTTYEAWTTNPAIEVPPCFIIVCNNTATSKLVFDYVAGFWRDDADPAQRRFEAGRLPLFRNFDDAGLPLPRPRTLLIDSEQLESGDALDDTFRGAAAQEIEAFRREIVVRTGNRAAADAVTDHALLREVMNTVGKKGRLGESIRCVVSVSMLTEGWDANTVTHVLGVRAFGTQLLCEQVIGRALRRQSYDLNAEGRFDVEYADILGVPFDFTAQPVVVGPPTVKPTVLVQAISPERDALEIRFPRVAGYRVALPNEQLDATFSDEHRLRLTPELVGPAQVRNEGIVGQGITLTLAHTRETRDATIAYHLARRLVMDKWRDPNGAPKLHLFGQLKAIAERWLSTHVECAGGTYPAQLLYLELADRACELITHGIVARFAADRPLTASLDPFNPVGSTRHVRFTTSKALRWQTSPRHCHINWALLDSGWEGELCRVLEDDPRVLAYVKNHNLGFEVPYRLGGTARRYRPDYLVRVDDGHGPDDPLHLVLEVKGRRGEDAKEKAATLRDYWVPAVNRLGTFGRWAAAEFTDPFTMGDDLGAVIGAELSKALSDAGSGAALAPALRA
jgi:type III restriction enzyme